MEQQQEFTELIPGLPEEIALECLIRVHYSAHRVASRVCRRWLELFHSGEFYYHRKQSGRTHKAACLVQSIPLCSDAKPVEAPSHGVSVFDPVSGSWDRVDPVPKYPFCLPLFCQITSTEGKVFVIGGFDPVGWNPVKDVFMYEFTTRSWTQCADMPCDCSFFAAGAAEGRIYIAGGHDESKNAMNTAWMYDVKANSWTELPRMSEERDECEGIVIGSEFWVVSGYDTENQGEFKGSAEVFNWDKGEWNRVEHAWAEDRCPRSSVGAGKNRRLRSWAELDSEIRVGVSGVDLGDRAVVSGSAYQGGPYGVYVVEKNNDGEIGKFTKMEVGDEFSGFVQSGCCVEI